MYDAVFIPKIYESMHYQSHPDVTLPNEELQTYPGNHATDIWIYEVYIQCRVWTDLLDIKVVGNIRARIVILKRRSTTQLAVIGNSRSASKGLVKLMWLTKTWMSHGWGVTVRSSVIMILSLIVGDWQISPAGDLSSKYIFLWDTITHPCPKRNYIQHSNTNDI